ncbi:MAG: CPBP family intramembrane metalloprotease [Gemmatimonadetes bacterium]|nr:CPBP family intramembrane metalloprotease [Gemmatimonadota bacterium]
MSILDRIFGPVPDLPKPSYADDEKRARLVLWISCVLLILLIFRGGFPWPRDFNPDWASWDPRGLESRIYWASWGFLFYLAIPALLLAGIFRESPARYGFRIYLSRRTVALYALMLAVMLPALFWASTQEAFLRKYPFVANLGPGWQEIVVWEVIYVTRFIALEFFFRGFLLFGIEGRFGIHNAVVISTIPYSLIHYAKPFPEAIGSIFAGAALGYTALRTRSIFGGVLLHGTVALGMDLLALWRKGVIFQ